MHSIFVRNKTRYDSTYIYDRYYLRTHVYICSFWVWKTQVLIIASLTLKVAAWGHPIRGTYRTNPSLYDWNLFEESWTWWLWVIEKRNVSVCRGHGLANALYIENNHLSTFILFKKFKLIHFTSNRNICCRVVDPRFRSINSLYFSDMEWAGAVGCWTAVLPGRRMDIARSTLQADAIHVISLPGFVLSKSLNLYCLVG